MLYIRLKVDKKKKKTVLIHLKLTRLDRVKTVSVQIAVLEKKSYTHELGFGRPLQILKLENCNSRGPGKL